MLPAEPVVGKATMTTAPLRSTLVKVSTGFSATATMGPTWGWLKASMAGDPARPTACVDRGRGETWSQSAWMSKARSWQDALQVGRRTRRPVLRAGQAIHEGDEGALAGRARDRRVHAWASPGLPQGVTHAGQQAPRGRRGRRAHCLDR